MFFFIKVVVSALVVAVASELAKYHRLLATIIISLPLVSILSFVWIYVESGDAKNIMNLSYNLFWLVLVSLVFYLILALLLKYDVNFWLSMILSSIGMAIFYWIIITFYRFFV